MSRKAERIICNENDINCLKMIVENKYASSALVTRARIILLSIEGLENKDIAKRLNIRPNTVTDTRKRFLENGIEGLYDRNRPGRRGSGIPSPAETVLSYVRDNLDSELDIQSISNALGIKDYTVRRILHNNNIQLKRSTVWDVETTDIVLGRYFQLGGIYLSSGIVAVIIRVLPGGEMSNASNKGVVVTKNRLEASDMTAYSKENDGLSLAEALRISSEHSKKDSKVISFDTFLQQLLSKDEAVQFPVHEYHAIVYRTENSGSLCSDALMRNIIVHSTETIEAWHVYVKKVLSILEPISGFSSGKKVLSALDSYMKTNITTPFAWHMVKVTPEITDSVRKEDTHLAHVNQTFEIHDGESVLVMSGVLLHCNEGRITQTVVHSSAQVPSPEDFDFSSVQGYTSTVTAFDDAITNTSTSLNQELMHACLNSHIKKNS